MEESSEDDYTVLIRYALWIYKLFSLFKLSQLVSL